MAHAAEGQYFGRNQVRWHDFDFQVLETEHFDLYHYQREAGTAELAGPLSDTDHVIGHELVHAFQYDMGGVTPGSPRYGAPQISKTPLWVVEGMAGYLSRGPESAMTAMWMRDALLRDDSLPSVAELRDTRTHFPYRYGHSLLAYIGGRWGEAAVVQIFRRSMGNGRPAATIEQTVGSADSVAAGWHRALRETYGPIRERTGAPGDFAEPIFEDHDSELDIGPALSPDGSRLLFLSQRSPVSVDLYLANAETGEIIRRVTRSALDPHYHSLQFISSAGAWAPDGDRFAFAAVRGASRSSPSGARSEGSG